MKKFFITIFVILLFILLLFGISLFFPGKLKFIDNIRLPIQGKIMGEVGDYLVGDFSVNNNGEVIPSKNAITYEELLPNLDTLNPGDIFFTDSEKYVSSEFIPGKWKHAGIYIGTYKQVEELFGKESDILEGIKKYYITGEEKMIIDAGKDGVNIREFNHLSNLNNISFLKAIVSYSINLKKDEKINFLKYAISQGGKKYNYDMTDIDEESFYCSQLVSKGLQNIGIEIEANSKTLGRLYTSPQDIVDSIKTNPNFELKFEIEKTN